MKKHLFTFGHGYSARAISNQLIRDGWSVTGTTRTAEKAGALREEGVVPAIWPGDDVSAALDQATHLLISTGPGIDGDPVLNALRAEITARKDQFEWVGYLSTTGVYGDKNGDWVDETSPLAPSTRRGQMRVEAEAAWQEMGLPLHIFRLAGIYGPGRGPFAKVLNGTARRIIKPNQVFSRIHVEDIAQAVVASIKQPDPGAVYNLCDDAPAPPEDVIAYAAELLGKPIPPAVDFATAQMSEMARSFYAESKRVRNDKIKQDLGISLIYPNYRVGLRALLNTEKV